MVFIFYLIGFRVVVRRAGGLCGEIGRCSHAA